MFGLQRRSTVCARASLRAALLIAFSPLLGACATAAQQARATGPNRDALRQIVQQQCLPHWRSTRDPAPCVRLALPDGARGALGYAVLADRKGGAHFLLIPTRTLRGIEDPRLLHSGGANYFEAAWEARDQLASVLGYTPRRDAVGLAINSALHRGQDQLHIHIECLQPRVHEALQGAAGGLRNRWTELRIDDAPYQALRILGQDLGHADPFKLLARGLPGALPHMGDYTLIVAGAQFDTGPGFIVLAGRTAPSGRDPLEPGPQWARPGETLLDASCAVAR